MGIVRMMIIIVLILPPAVEMRISATTTMMTTTNKRRRWIVPLRLCDGNFRPWCLLVKMWAIVNLNHQFLGTHYLNSQILPSSLDFSVPRQNHLGYSCHWFYPVVLNRSFV